MTGHIFWLELPDAFISILLAYYFLTFKIFAVRYALMELSARRGLVSIDRIPLGVWFSRRSGNFPQACCLLCNAWQSIWLNVHNLRI